MLNSWPKSQCLDIVGDGPLRSLVEERCSVSRNLRYLGIVDRDELQSSLRRYMGLVLPSLWSEGLPTVVLEAMAQGTPSLVSKEVGAAQELLELGVASVYDPRSGTSGIGEGLSRLSMQRETYRRRCHEVHSQEFSPQAWLRRIEHVYERIRD